MSCYKLYIITTAGWGHVLHPVWGQGAGDPGGHRHQGARHRGLLRGAGPQSSCVASNVASKLASKLASYVASNLARTVAGNLASSLASSLASCMVMTSNYPGSAEDGCEDCECGGRH